MIVLPHQEVDPEEIRDRADEILSRPEYNERAPTLASRVLDWVFGQLDEVLATLFGGSRGTVFGYLVVLVAVALALWFLWRVIPRRRPRRAAPVAEVVMATTERLGRRDWLDRASAAEAEARWDEAVHARYHALVEGLAEQGRLPDDPSFTAAEQRRWFAGRRRGRADAQEHGKRRDTAIDGAADGSDGVDNPTPSPEPEAAPEVGAATPELAATFAQTSRRFEDVWFGAQPAAAADASEAQAADDRLLGSGS